MVYKNHKSNELIVSLGLAIRERRVALSLSQEAFAELTGFDRTYISLIERGGRNPSFTNLCRFARALEITPSELIKDIK